MACDIIHCAARFVKTGFIASLIAEMCNYGHNQKRQYYVKYMNIK